MAANRTKGFIQQVSEITMSPSKVEYFTADLQTGREHYDRIICFDPEMRDIVKKAETTKQVHILEGVSMKTTKRQLFQNEVKVGRSTKIRKVDKKADYTYKMKTVEVTATKAITLSDIATTDEESVSLTAKVHKLFPKDKTVNGIDIQIVVLADSKTTGTLSLFGKHIDTLTAEKTYKIHDVKIIKFQSKKQLQSKYSSTFEVDTDVENAVSGQKKEKKFDIVSVTVITQKLCPLCHQVLDIDDEFTVKCDRCGRLKLKNVLSKLSVVVANKDEKIAISTELLSTLVDAAIMNDENELELKLLEFDTLTLMYEDDQLVKVSGNE